MCVCVCVPALRGWECLVTFASVCVSLIGTKSFKQLLWICMFWSQWLPIEAKQRRDYYFRSNSLCPHQGHFPWLRVLHKMHLDRKKKRKTRTAALYHTLRHTQDVHRAISRRQWNCNYYYTRKSQFEVVRHSVVGGWWRIDKSSASSLYVTVFLFLMTGLIMPQSEPRIRTCKQFFIHYKSLHITARAFFKSTVQLCFFWVFFRWISAFQALA